MDKETWTFINTFSAWLSALGTIAAVVTSLYLARRSDRIALKTRIGIRMVAVKGGLLGDGTEFVFLNITNLGRRSATITKLFWQLTPWNKTGLLWLAPQNVFSSNFPITLRDGEEANYALPLSEFEANFIDYARKEFSGIKGLIRLKFLKMSVYTSTDVVCKCRPEKPLRHLMRKLSKEKNSQEEENT